ncbi:MAG: glycosyltransferase family 4 protein [Bacteroidota bacterium]
MTIAFDVSYIQSLRAGYGRFSLELLQGLLKNDQQNRYLLYGWSFSLDNKVLSGFNCDNVELRTLRIPGFVKRLHWNTIRSPKLESLIGNFDIFHGAEPLLPPTAKATIATVYDLAYKKYPQYFESNVLQWDSSIQRSLNGANAIIVPSENTKNDLIVFFTISQDKIHVIHPPASDKFSPNKSERDEKIKERYGINGEFILFTGTFEPRKNIPFLIRGFEKFQENHKNVQLVLVGKPGWLDKDIFQSLRQSKASSNIKYLNYIEEDDLSALYRSAIFFVYPSLYEGYGFPVIEAMASGTPVITSKTSSLGEIACDAALLIDPTNLNELVDAMDALYRNSALRLELRDKGILKTSHLTRETMAHTVIDIYKSIRS